MSALPRPAWILPAARLLDADGERTADVAVSAGRLQIPPRVDGTVLRAGLHVSLPLVDAHCHCIRMRDFAAGAPHSGHAATAERALRAMRGAGTGLLRDAGDPTAGTVAPLSMARRPSARPVLVSCGAFLAGPGESRPGVIECPDEETFVEAVQTQARLTGGWVKLLGDRITPEGLEPALPTDWIGLAVASARAAGQARVAIHAMAHETIEAALEAGVGSLEHGTDVSADQVDRLAAKGILWIPTLLAVTSALEVRGHEAPLRDRVGRLTDALARAHALGVTILAGTDGFVPHGAAALEGLALASSLGPDAAFAALTHRGRSAFGLGARLEDGARADLVATVSDPRTDPSALLRPAALFVAGRMRVPHDVPRPRGITVLIDRYFAAPVAQAS